MELISRDALIKELTKNDLEFMQQADLMVCLKDIINRQPVIEVPNNETRNNKPRKYLVTRKQDTVEVLLIPNVNDGTWSYVNMTKGHICPCRFKSIDDAVMDMDRLKSKGEIIRYEQVQ